MKTKRIRTILIIAAAIMALLVVGFVAYSRLATAGPQQEAIDALVSDDVVGVQTGDWYVFEPADSATKTGLVFYPGGYVDPRAYAPPAREIAAAGYLVVIPTMPLNLAILGANQAAEIIDAYPGLDQWAIGGHSLGGAMAAQYASGDSENIDGLALWASYPAGHYI